MSSEAGEVAIDDHEDHHSDYDFHHDDDDCGCNSDDVNFISSEHYHHQADPGLSYSDLGCRSQPLDTAVIMEQSAGCGPDGVGLSPSEDTPKCSREQQTKSL